ncbi:MAG: hypothetical protein WCI51_01735 [Lentisphaerota bacterium]
MNTAGNKTKNSGRIKIQSNRNFKPDFRQEYKIDDCPAMNMPSPAANPSADSSSSHLQEITQQRKSVLDYLKQLNQYRFTGYSGPAQSRTGQGWRYIHQHPWHSLAIGLGVMAAGIAFGYFGAVMIAAGVAIQSAGTALLATAATILAWSVGLGVLMVLLTRSIAPVFMALIGMAFAAAFACGGIAVVCFGAVIGAIGAVAGVLGTITVCASIILILNWMVQFLRESHDEIRQWQYVKINSTATAETEVTAQASRLAGTGSNYDEQSKYQHNSLYNFTQGEIK